jgi:hypothetical protein
MTEPLQELTCTINEEKSSICIVLNKTCKRIKITNITSSHLLKPVSENSRPVIFFYFEGVSKGISMHVQQYAQTGKFDDIDTDKEVNLFKFDFSQVVKVVITGIDFHWNENPEINMTINIAY